MPPKRRIEGHVRLLGILWISYGALHVLPGLLAFTVGEAVLLALNVPPFVNAIIGIIASIFLVMGFAAAILGYGLLSRQTWARMGSIVVAILSLPNVPLGTGLGIYTLWALLPADHEEQYRALTRVA